MKVDSVTDWFVILLIIGFVLLMVWLMDQLGYWCVRLAQRMRGRDMPDQIARPVSSIDGVGADTVMVSRRNPLRTRASHLRMQSALVTEGVDSNAEEQFRLVETGIGNDLGGIRQGRDKTNPVARVRWKSLTYGQRRAIRRHARRDYQNARGYAHLRLLLDVRKSLVQRKMRVQEDIANADRKIEALRAKEKEELLAALEIHLIENRLYEIYGIGSQLKQRILQTTRAKRLKDLYRARTVPGIGETKLVEIEKWIRTYSGRLPELVESPFPGRDTIVRRYHSEIAATELEGRTLRETLSAIQQQLASSDPAVIWLAAVQPSTFCRAAMGSPPDIAAAERFLVGIFAEWEPVPEWFQQIQKEIK